MDPNKTNFPRKYFNLILMDNLKTPPTRHEIDRCLEFSPPGYSTTHAIRNDNLGNKGDCQKYISPALDRFYNQID